MVIGRMFSAHSVPAFRISAPLVAALMKPVLAATGRVRMTSFDVRRYQVKLRSATSLKSPRSTPSSSSRVRSGLSWVARVVSLKRPPNRSETR